MLYEIDYPEPSQGPVSPCLEKFKQEFPTVCEDIYMVSCTTICYPLCDVRRPNFSCKNREIKPMLLFCTKFSTNLVENLVRYIRVKGKETLC